MRSNFSTAAASTASLPPIRVIRIRVIKIRVIKIRVFRPSESSESIGGDGIHGLAAAVDASVVTNHSQCHHPSPVTHHHHEMSHHSLHQN